MRSREQYTNNEALSIKELLKEKTDLSKIEKVISGLGYQANKTLADPIAYEGLPGFCKIGGMH